MPAVLNDPEDEDGIKQRTWDFPGYTTADDAAEFLRVYGRDAVDDLLSGELVAGRAMPAGLRAGLEELVS